MKKSFIFYFLCILTQNALAQGGGIGGISGNTVSYDSFVAVNDFFNKVNVLEVAEEVQGTPFLFDHWSDGRIVLGERLIGDIKIKYNIANDEVMILRLKHGDSVSLKVDKTKGFFIWNPDGRIMEFENFKYYEAKSKRMEEGIFQKLYVGNNKLLIRKRKTLKKFDLSSPANTAGGLKNTYLSADTYYVLKEDNLLMPFKRSKKGLAFLFPGKDKELKDYLKDNKLNLKSDQDLVKVVAFLDQ